MDKQEYLLQITLGNKATSSIQDVILTDKKAHNPMEVLQEKLSSYSHLRFSLSVELLEKTYLSVAFNVFVH